MKFWGIRLVSVIAAIAFCMMIDGMSRHYSDYIVRLTVLTGLFITLSVSLNLINGITGQFSIGHAAFYQIGAYLGGYMTVHYLGRIHIPDIPWLILTMIGGAIGAAVAGFVVGLPSLRLRGDYLAIVTLGFGEIIRIIVQNTKEVGAAYGLQIDHKIQSVWLVWLLAVVCIAVSRNLIKTARGLLFLSVREDEIAASAMGVNVMRAKLVSFILGSAFAGAAGSLYAHYEGFITPTTFGMDVSFIILTMVVLGGTGSITGSVISAVVLTLLPEILRNFQNAHGQGLTLPASAIIASLLALIVALALIKRTSDHALGSAGQRGLKYLAAIAVGIIAELVFSFLFGKIGALATKQIAVEQLRLSVFAITLIVLMLLRPQGLLAHHEFSWAWVRKVFGRKAPETAVAT